MRFLQRLQLLLDPPGLVARNQERARVGVAASPPPRTERSRRARPGFPALAAGVVGLSFAGCVLIPDAVKSLEHPPLERIAFEATPMPGAPAAASASRLVAPAARSAPSAAPKRSGVDYGPSEDALHATPLGALPAPPGAALLGDRYTSRSRRWAIALVIPFLQTTQARIQRVFATNDPPAFMAAVQAAATAGGMRVEYVRNTFDRPDVTPPPEGLPPLGLVGQFRSPGVVAYVSFYDARSGDPAFRETPQGRWIDFDAARYAEFRLVDRATWRFLAFIRVCEQLRPGDDGCDSIRTA